MKYYKSFKITAEKYVYSYVWFIRHILSINQFTKLSSNYDVSHVKQYQNDVFFSFGIFNKTTHIDICIGIDIDRSKILYIQKR